MLVFLSVFPDWQAMEEQRTCLVNHRHSVSTQCSMQLFLTISRNILIRMKFYIPHTKIKKNSVSKLLHLCALYYINIGESTTIVL